MAVHRTLPPLAALALALGLAWAALAWAGCTKDTDCKGDRICDPEGQCVDPQPCPPCDCDEEPAPPEPAPAPPERPAPPDGSALVITLTGDAPTTAVEVSCPGGVRVRAPFVEGVATVSGVPAEACAVHFKGPVNARFQPVQGGQSLICYLQGATAVCE